MIVKFLKDWTLPLAMLAGIAGYPIFTHLAFLTPWLIFCMLLFTFCNIAPSELKLRPWHLWLLAIQVIGSFVVYMLLQNFDKIVAEGALICIMAPTATAAAVITQKLGGNPGSVVSYTLLANMGTAVAVPVVFPLIEAHPELSFWVSSLLILSKMLPLLIFPFILALLLREFLPKVHRKLQDNQEIAFYLWTLSLMIVTAQTFESLISNNENAYVKILLALVALGICCLQFFVGKTIGSAYGERISAGQALGQKNTVLAIWMTHTYLNPLASVAPGAYVLWQNIVNSWQLWKKRRADIK